MNSTTRVVADHERTIFGEGVIVLPHGDEVEFQFTYYRSDSHVRVALEHGKVSIYQLADLTLAARNNASEAVALYLGEAA